MSGGQLRVDPQQLRSVETSLKEVADTLTNLQADVPLGDAAGAVAQLRTAEACRKAQAHVADAVTAATESVRSYGANLTTAAQAYAGKDQAGAEAIEEVDVPR